MTPAPAQLSLLDPPADTTAPLPRGLERLGATVEFGELLLRPLVADGWEVEQVRAFAGEGVLVIARKGPFEVKRVGGKLADVAPDLFKECVSLRGKL